MTTTSPAETRHDVRAAVLAAADVQRSALAGGRP